MTPIKNPFMGMLDELNSRALFDLSERMQECIERTQHTGKMSTLTLTLKFKPHGHGQMEIADEIKTSLPEFPRATTLMFTTDDGQLVKENPNQRKLDLKSVSTQPTQFKEVK